MMQGPLWPLTQFLFLDLLAARNNHHADTIRNIPPLNHFGCLPQITDA